MIPKQDRQGVRTPADLEQKYNFSQMSSGGGKNTAELTRQISQLNQTQTEFMAVTNTKFVELSEELKEYIDNIIIELSGIDDESGDVSGDSD